MTIKSHFNEDFKWCIDNDFQVYIKLVGKGAYIAVRKGGISSCGKDNHYDKITSMEYTSKENLGKIYYKTVQEAMDCLPKAYKHLRYGKI